MNGGSFEHEGCKSSEERIAILERKIAAYVARFQEYDRYIADLVGRLEEHDKKAEDHARKLLLSSSDFKYCMAQANEHHNQVRESFESIDKEHCSAARKIECLQVQIDMIQKEVVAQKQKVADGCEKLSSDMASKQQLKLFEQEFNEKLKPLATLLSVVGSFDKKIADQCAVSNAQFMELSSKLRDVQDYMKSFEDKLTLQDSGNSNIKMECVNRVNQLIVDYQRYVDEKFDAVKRDLKGSPGDLKSAKEDIMARFESVALDGSNAVLRATNASAKVLVLEKKIENLYLLVNQLQLKA